MFNKKVLYEDPNESCQMLSTCPKAHQVSYVKVTVPRRKMFILSEEIDTTQELQQNLICSAHDYLLIFHFARSTDTVSVFYCKNKKQSEIFLKIRNELRSCEF